MVPGDSLRESRSTSGPALRSLLAAVESGGAEPVGDGERHGRPVSGLTLWFSSNIQFATLTTGMLGTGVFGLSFALAVAATAVAAAIGAMAVGAMATLGPRYGVGQLVQSRGPLGYDGNRVPALLVFVKACSWFAVNSVLGAFALGTLAAIPFTPAFCLVIGFQLVTALIGYRFIHRVQRVMAVVLTALFAVLSVYAFGVAELDAPFDPGKAGPLGVGGAFALTIAVNAARSLSFAGYASDYTRYLPRGTSPARIFLAAFSGVFLASVWIGSLGAAIGTLTVVGTPTDLVGTVLPPVLAGVAMLALAMSTSASSCLDCYSGSMASLVMGVPLRRWQAVLVVGAIGGAVGWGVGQGDYWQSFQTFLFLLGYWIGPWLGVMVAYHWLGGGAPDTAEFYRRDRRVGPGLAAWIAGIAVSVPFMNQEGVFVGPVAAACPWLGDVTALVGFLTGLATHRFLALRSPDTPVTRSR